MKYAILLLTMFLMACNDSASNNDTSRAVNPTNPISNISCDTTGLAQISPQSVVSNWINKDKINDDDINSFSATGTLALNDTFYVALELNAVTNVTCIEMYEYQIGGYYLGDLTIQISSDSTDGLNGTWTDLATATASDGLMNNGYQSYPIGESFKWIKFVSIYTGDGAHGQTPSFYLSEVYFY